MRFLKKIILLIVVVFGILMGGLIILFGYQDLPLETLKETYANTESQFMALEGMEVHYRDEGPKTDSIPIVLIHGTGDDNVHVQNSIKLQEALIKENKQFTSFYYPDKNHGIYGGNTRLHLYTLMTNFILKEL